MSKRQNFKVIRNFFEKSWEYIQNDLGIVNLKTNRKKSSGMRVLSYNYTECCENTMGMGKAFSEHLITFNLSEVVRWL